MSSSSDSQQRKTSLPPTSAGKIYQAARQILDEDFAALKFLKHGLHSCQRADPIVHRPATSVLAFRRKSAEAFLITLGLLTQAVEFREPQAQLRQQCLRFFARVMFL